MSAIKIPIQPEIDSAKLKSESTKAGKIVENEFEKAGKNAGKSLTSGISKKFGDLKTGISDSFSTLKSGDIQGSIGGLVGSVTSFAGAWGVAGAAIAGVATKIYGVVAETMKLQNQVSQLTGLTGNQLAGVTANISAISKTFDVSFEETLKAANSLAKGMGIPIEEAMKTIEDGFINGANSGGEFLAQLTEYPTFFKEAGLNAQQMGSYIEEASKQGIFADKGGDLIKESTLRLREMASGTKDALKGIGLDGDVIQTALKDGTMTVFEAMQKITGKMGELPAKSAAVGTAIADIFGGPGEDVGLPFLLNLSKMNLQTELLTKNMTYAQREQKAQLEAQKSQEMILNKITLALTPLIVGMKELYSNALKWVIDGFSYLYEVLKPVIEYVKTYVISYLEFLAQIFITVWDAVKAVYTIFEALWPVLKYTLAVAFLPLAAAIGTLIGLFKLLKLGLEGISWLFNQIADIIKTYVAPVFKEIGDTIDGVLDPLKSFLGLETEAEAATKKLNEENQKANDILKEYGFQVEETQKKQKGYNDELKKTAPLLKGINDESQKAMKQVEGMGENYLWATQQIGELDTGSKTAVNNAIKRFTNWFKTGKLTETGFKDLLKKVKELSDPSGIPELTGVIEEGTDAIGKQGEAVKQTVMTLDDYIKALVKLDGKEFDEMFKKALNLKNETDKLADATKRVTALLELGSDKGFKEFADSINEYGIGSLDNMTDSIMKSDMKGFWEEQTDAVVKASNDEVTARKDTAEKIKAINEKRAADEKELAQKELDIKTEKFQSYVDFTTGGLDILLSTEKTNLGERLKAFGLYLVNVIEKASIAAVIEATIAALAKAPATWGASIIEGLAYIAGIKVAAAGAKALLGAEDGTDFGKPLNLHKGKPKGKDSILMAITPDEYNYGIMSDKALNIGRNREYAQMMNKGINIESMVLRNQSNLNDVNIVRQLQASNQRLERIERSNLEVAKRFNSNSTVNVKTSQDIKLKVDNMGNWRY